MASNNKLLTEYTRTDLTILLTEKLSKNGFHKFHISKNTFDAMLKKIKILVTNNAFDYNPYYIDSFYKECPHFQGNNKLRCAIGAFINPFYADNYPEYEKITSFPYKIPRDTCVLFLANIYAICNQNFSPSNKTSFKTIKDYVNYIDTFIDDFPYQEITYFDSNIHDEKCIYETEEEITSLKTFLKTLFHKEHGADVYIAYENFRAEIDSCLSQTNAKDFYFMPSDSLATIQTTSDYITSIFGCWERILFGNIHNKAFFEKASSFLDIIYEDLNIMKQKTDSDFNVLFDHLEPFSLCNSIDFGLEYPNIFGGKYSESVYFQHVDYISEYYEKIFNQLIDFYSTHSDFFFSFYHQETFICILKYCHDALRPYLKKKVTNLKTMPENIDAYIQSELQYFLTTVNEQPMIKQTQSPRKHIVIPLSLKKAGIFTPILEKYFSRENIYAAIDDLPVPSLNLIYPFSLKQASESTNLTIPINLIEWNQISTENQKKILHELCDFSNSLIQKYLSSSDDVNTSD